MTKYLITGIGGFVGRHLAEHILSSDPLAEILGLDRQIDDDRLDFPHKSVRLESVDLTDSSVFDDLISDFRPRYVVHLAANSSVGKSWKNPVDCTLNNLGMLLNLFEGLRRTAEKNPDSPCRILAVGSSEVYRAGNSFQEDGPLRPENPYAVARLAQEHFARIYSEHLGLDVVSTRSFMHIGPGQDERFAVASFVRQLTDAAKEGRKRATLRTGNVDVRRDVCDVRDVVRAYKILLEKGRRGEIYNVCRGEALSLRKIIEMIAEILKIEAIVETDSALFRPGDLPLVLGDEGKIHRETGWTPTISLEQTLRDMIDYRMKSGPF